MPPAKNSMRSDLLHHKPTNSGEEPIIDLLVGGTGIEPVTPAV
jgi:hypothetical protein